MLHDNLDSTQRPWNVPGTHYGPLRPNGISYRVRRDVCAVQEFSTLIFRIVLTLFVCGVVLSATLSSLCRHVSETRIFFPQKESSFGNLLTCSCISFFLLRYSHPDFFFFTWLILKSNLRRITFELKYKEKFFSDEENSLLVDGRWSQSALRLNVIPNRVAAPSRLTSYELI